MFCLFIGEHVGRLKVVSVAYNVTYTYLTRKYVYERAYARLFQNEPIAIQVDQLEAMSVSLDALVSNFISSQVFLWEFSILSNLYLWSCGDVWLEVL